MDEYESLLRVTLHLFTAAQLPASSPFLLMLLPLLLLLRGFANPAPSEAAQSIEVEAS